MRSRHHLAQTRDASRVLGLQVAAARRRARRSAAEIAERAGITRETLRRVERGDPTVAIGIVFDVATVVGVHLFGASRRELAAMVDDGERDLALLPARIHPDAPEVDDAF